MCSTLWFLSFFLSFVCTNTFWTYVTHVENQFIQSIQSIIKRDAQRFWPLQSPGLHFFVFTLTIISGIAAALLKDNRNDGNECQ